MSVVVTLAMLFFIPAIGAYVGFDLAFRFMDWSAREAARDEVRSILTPIIQESVEGIAQLSDLQSRFAGRVASLPGGGAA